MGLSCSEQLARLVLGLFSLCLSICSIVIIVLGSIFVAATQDTGDIKYNYAGAHTLALVFLVAGLVVFVTGFLGCCGAVLKSENLMKVYAVFLVLFMTLLVLVLVLTFKNRGEAENLLTSSFEASMKNYTKNNDTQNAWDALQNKLECCGSSGYKSWHLVDQEGFPSEGDVPDSCCLKKYQDAHDTCDNQPKHMYDNGVGCATVAYDTLRQYENFVVLCVIIIGLVDLVALTMACWLSNSFFRQHGGYEQL